MVESINTHARRKLNGFSIVLTCTVDERSVKMSQKILLVDDDDDLRTMLEAILDADGYDIDSAKDLDGAFNLMASSDYEIMLLDKNMPGINGNSEGGMDLLKHVRSLCLPSEVIMMTGDPTVETAIEAMKLGAFDYITKPFSLKDLRLKIRRLAQYRNFVESGIYCGVLQAPSDKNARCDRSCVKNIRSWTRSNHVAFERRN